MMECFNSLLLKLREVHERELEGWQMKIQELSNKKGCDTKRMEELFTKNQQMKEQQRLLTENIKTLENRLRAGLCDRCTVTQEVAKRRQQEFEASQIQSLQHISLLAAEMNNLKKENKKLREEIRTLRAALDRGHSDLSSSSSEVKISSPPDLSPSSGPVSLISMATGRSSIQPAEGDVSVKTEAEHRAESEHRPWGGINRYHYESYKPLSSTSWKPEQQSVSRAAERRSQGAEGLDHRSPLPPQALPLKNSSSSSSGDVSPSRHVLHPPAPCRPQPIKSSPGSLTWPLSEPSDWVSAPGSSLVMPPSPKSHPLRFPNLIQTGQPGRKQAFGSLWHKQSALKPPTKEPTVLFRLRSLGNQSDSPSRPQERKEIQTSRTERGSADGLREACEGPLDLSERGKTKPNQTAGDYSPFTLRGEERVHDSPDRDANPSAQRAEPSPVPRSSSCSSSPAKVQEEERPTDHDHTEQRDELNGQTEQNNNKKVPVLTLSLRPVVVLETLNSALKKQDSPSDSKSSSPAAETGSSSDGQEEEECASDPRSNRSCKRKRTSAETEMDRDSETDNIQPERKIQISVRAEEKSPR